VVKALSFFKRHAGMPVEEFQAYWRGRHPDVVTKLPGVRRYVQSHTRTAAYRSGEPMYDGIAEVWFQNTAAMHDLRGTAELAGVQADEARFIDRSTMGLIITDDHVVAYTRGRDPAWDGVAIIWFDDSAALRAATTTPEWDRVKADDGNFIATGPVAFM
jgi:uncharacterized protein (TIGR02118 family)